ncbi:MAG: type III pantothenate kinase [Planctomycetota bacterium]|nr:type III pantothenate kinase [Planctomycetota bacterium]
MTPLSRHGLIAVDIGNSRIKFGYFAPVLNNAPDSTAVSNTLPEPASCLTLSAATDDFAELAAWVETLAPAGWLLASVHRQATERLQNWLHSVSIQSAKTGALAAAHQYQVLNYQQLPLKVRVKRPEEVGIDRLLGAVAANRLRHTSEPAIVISVGSAITVNWVDATGAFCGGAILPGIAMSARAMHDFTDLLPLIPMQELADPPAVLGISTDEAMRSGLYWGAVGAIRELIERLSATYCTASNQQPRIFLTGGAASAVAELLGRSTVHVPHLMLAGLAISASAVGNSNATEQQ